jgi:Icc-related predicted phosphoesterase
MKFLTFVDLHEDKKALKLLLERAKEEDIEFLVCAGDLSQFSRNLRFMLRQLNELGKKIYVLPGNHESDRTLSEVLPDYPNFVAFHKKEIEINNYIFLGYGEGGFAQEDVEFRRIAREWYGKHKGKKTVLVTHGPPYGTKTDLLDGHYVGNKDFRSFIERIEPHLVICGHIHETAGQVDNIRKTKIVNPGCEGKVIELN